ncbi:muscle-specific protein 20-like [Dysidea avara]|uniref:muscle-specific protein 20-like n=1 Tax=Dysidea avara TaxID=196820 RepID=UPI00331C8D51
MADRPKGYGMTAELADKKAAKRDPELEAQAIEWMQAVTEEPFPTDVTFEEALKDGVYLCNLINILQPGSVKKINTSKMAFKQMENIGNFLEGCFAYGLSKEDMFQTVDLYEAQNIPQVTNGIHALGRRAQKKGFDGPVLGPKEATEQRREFDEATKQAGQAVIGLQMGSNQGASQSGMSFGTGRQIHSDKY